MILYYLWKAGIFSHTDGEKIRFFLGLVRNPLALSRRWPLIASINWVRAAFVPAYAKALARWMAYRVELYDGHRG